MNRLFFTLLTGSILAAPAFAQPAPKEGYSNLVSAAARIIRDPAEEYESNQRKLSPQQLLQLQSISVDQNQEAMRLIRDALRLPITVPIAGDTAYDFWNLERFHNAGRAFADESTIRTAEGNFTGAIESAITTIQLGSVLTQNANSTALTQSIELQTLGYGIVEKLIPKLDGETLKKTQAWLVALDSNDLKFSRIDAADKLTQLAETKKTFGSETEKAVLKEEFTSASFLKDSGLTLNQVNAFFELSPDEIAAKISEVFDARAQQDNLPYSETKNFQLPPVPDTLSWMLNMAWRRQGELRFQFELNRTRRRLLQAIIELQTVKLEKGAYPETFEAPLDPFGNDSRLVYTRTGDSYALYSVGPDGQDDGGAEIQTLEVNPETGAKTVSDNLNAGSFGDISASPSTK